MRSNPKIGKIANPFKLKVSDLILLRKNLPTVNKDWEKRIYNDLKARIKNHYSFEQNDYCAYCRTQINFLGYNEPLEHIILKDYRPEWMFEPLNIALSCDECNTRKATKHTLRASYRKSNTFLTASNNYRIIHPHHDNFEDHIKIIDDLFYQAITRDKGFIHILIFGLWHFQTLSKRARALNISKRDHYFKIYYRLQQSVCTRHEKKALRTMTNRLIDRLTDPL